MPTEVLAELWDTKDSIAKEHNYDLDKLANYFRKQQKDQSNETERQASNITAEHDAPADPSAAAISSRNSSL